MSGHFADDLIAAIARKRAPVCVGIDPVYDRIPDSIRKAAGGDEIAAIREFCREVLLLVEPIVPAIKIQIAYFEIYRDKGIELYYEIVKLARQLDLLVIGDVKRNDIGSTAEAYAKGHLGGRNAVDSVTINGYLGSDGIFPFLDEGDEDGKGIFVLVRTSNPSAVVIQDLVSQGKPIYEHMAEQVKAIGDDERLIGSSGYSRVGAVVGATYPEQARHLRQVMPRQIFLVPGYGAQGASASDCAASFKSDGTGAIVNASRSVLFAHQKAQYAGLDWKKAVAQAAQAFAQDIARAVF